MNRFPEVAGAAQASQSMTAESPPRPYASTDASHEASLRRALLVTREFPPAIGPHSIRMAKLTKYLPRFGWETTVVTAPVDHAWRIDPSLEQDALGQILRVPRLFASIIHPRRGISASSSDALPTPEEWGRTTKGRLARWLIPDSSVLWALAVARLKRSFSGLADVIYASGPPFSTFLAAERIARRLDVPWVCEYRDNWTTNPLYRRRFLLDRVNRRLENRLLRSAAAVVVISDAAREELVRAFPFVRDRIAVAPNGYDPDDIPPPQPRPDAFEIAYAGSLYRLRDPSTFFVALRDFAARDPVFAKHLRLRLLGNIPRWVVARARVALGPEHVFVEGMVPHRTALRICASAAVLLAISSEAEAGNTSMTSKLMEYLGLRRPILLLAPPGPGTRLLAELRAGLSAPPDDRAAIEMAVAELFERWMTGSEYMADPEKLRPFSRIETAARVAATLELARASATVPEWLRSQPGPEMWPLAARLGKSASLASDRASTRRI